MRDLHFVPMARHRDAASFRRHWQSLAPELDCVDRVTGRAGPLGRPLEVFGRRLDNRFVIQPMEGWDGDESGGPTELTLRRWRRFGAGGAGLVWGGEAFAVSAEGRANPRQLAHVEQEATRRGLAALLRALREGARSAGVAAPVVGLQLTHSGRFSCPEGEPRPLPAMRHRVLDERLGIGSEHPLLSDAELEGVAERFVATAALAAEAGFDFVDVKCCHGYLLHELLGARSRPGPYGGDLSGRTRLLRRIIAAVRVAAPGLGIGVRVSAGDLHPFLPEPESGLGAPVGWREHLPYDDGFGVDRDDPRRMDFEEPIAFLRLLVDLGVPVANLSLGSPYWCPHLQRPAAFPPSDGYLPPRDPLAGVAEHVRAARLLKAAVPEILTVGSGYTYLQEWLGHVAEHEVGEGRVDLVGIGRMALAHPELPRDLLDGRVVDRKRLCRTFSDCTTAPRHGMPSGCYPLDEHYRALPEAARVAAIRRRLRG